MRPVGPRPTSLATLHDSSLGLDRPALIDLSVDPTLRLTYDELDSLMARVAGGLAARSIGHGDHVGILAENSARWVVAFFAILRLGAVAVPLSPRLPDGMLHAVAMDADARLVLTDAANASRLPDSPPTQDIDADDLLGPMVAPAPVDPDDTAILLYTSGSTGRPKGALLSHRSQLFTLESWASVETSRTMTRTLVAAQLFHKNGLGETKLGLWLGAEVVLQRRFDARAYLQAAAALECSTLSGVPTMFALMMAEHELLGRLDLTCVRGLEIGSAPLTEALLERVRSAFPKAAIYNSYGTTEVAAIFGDHHPSGGPAPRTSIGYPLETVEVRLVGDDGAEANPGELWVRCEGVMSGYLKAPEQTRAKLVEGWCRTGDVMVRDDDGWFHFVGRTDDMFVCGGENVYPGAVEQMLECHPSIRQAAVVPVPDEVKDAVPVAFVVRTKGDLSEDDVKRWTLEHGPAAQHPRAVWFLDKLPLSGTEKVDRTGLVEEAARRRSIPGG